MDKFSGDLPGSLLKKPKFHTFNGFLGNYNLTEKIAPFTGQRGKSFLMYTRATMPRRYHFSKNERIGDIVLESAVGATIFK